MVPHLAELGVSYFSLSLLSFSLSLSLFLFPSRVIENESKNKMSEANITRVLGPTLMTVDVDNVSCGITVVPGYPKVCLS